MTSAQHTVSTATFAAGCFWGVEETFRKLDGVINTQVGYTGGRTENPTYEAVCNGDTGHAEAIEIQFDPKAISYKALLEAFFDLHDPTTKNRQGPDIGSQYRSAIFYHDAEQQTQATDYITQLNQKSQFNSPIVTEVTEAQTFYPAEEYHQRYYDKKSRMMNQLFS